MGMEIRELAEFRIEADLKEKIGEILRATFEGYPRGKTFLQQTPSFRLLAFDGQKLCGHMAVHHREISSQGKSHTIFGIADLCVLGPARKKGIASSLIHALEALAVTNEVEFLVLITDVHQFYLKNGFHTANNRCCWLVLQNNQSFGLVKRRVEDGLMYKEIGDSTWPKGEIDLMGHVF